MLFYFHESFRSFSTGRGNLVLHHTEPTGHKFYETQQDAMQSQQPITA